MGSTGSAPTDRESRGIDEEMRGQSCYTTPPDESLALFAEARARCPVSHSDELDGHHLLLGYDQVKRAAANYELFSSEPTVLRPMLPGKPIPALEMDPPRHEQWRALFNQALTVRTASVLEPQVRSDVNRHIDDFIERGSAELVSELAEPVPAETICHLVGVDRELVPTVREKAVLMFAAQGEPEEFARRQADFAELTIGEVRRRQSEPREDFLTYLSTVEVEHHPLDDAEWVVLLGAFLGAGHHSTTSAMASLIYEVFKPDGARAELVADRELITAAIEETLRLHPPFFGLFRRTTAETEVAGVAIPEEDDVFVAYAAANRDPEMFPEPDEFRLDRGRNRHLSFGFGIHTCPGAILARMELRVLIEEMLRRLPDLEIATERPRYEFSGCYYSHLPVLSAIFTAGSREAGE